MTSNNDSKKFVTYVCMGSKKILLEINMIGQLVEYLSRFNSSLLTLVLMYTMYTRIINDNVCWSKRTCFSKKCATLVRWSWGMVGNTRSAVSKSPLITAVWYSKTDRSREYDTMFNSLSFRYSLEILWECLKIIYIKYR